MKVSRWPWPSQQAAHACTHSIRLEILWSADLRHNSERYALQEPGKSKNLRRSKRGQSAWKADFLFEFGTDYSSIIRDRAAHPWLLLLREIFFVDIFGFIFSHEEKKWIKGQLWSISTRNIVLPLMPSIFLLIFSFFLMISKYYHLFYKIRAKSFSRRHRFSLNIWQSLRIKHWSLCNIYPNRNYLSK